MLSSQAVVVEPFLIDLSPNNLGSLPRFAIRLLIYCSSQLWSGILAEETNIGWFSEHSYANRRMRRIGQQLSPVGLKVKTMPLPSGSALCLGSKISIVSVSSKYLMNLGTIHWKSSASLNVPTRRIYAMTIMVNPTLSSRVGNRSSSLHIMM